MKYQIMGTTMPAVEIQFDRPGESVYTQSGGMTWMTDGVQMSTNAKGGLMKGLGRMFAGESMFMATYTAEHAGSVEWTQGGIPSGTLPDSGGRIAL